MEEAFALLVLLLAIAWLSCCSFVDALDLETFRKERLDGNGGAPAEVGVGSLVRLNWRVPLLSESLSSSLSSGNVVEDLVRAPGGFV